MPVPARPRAVALGLIAIVWIAAATGCLPTRSPFLNVPLESSGPFPRTSVVRIPATDLASRFGEEPTDFGFYLGSRIRLPARAVDENGDRRIDAWLVEPTLRRERDRLLIVVGQTDGTATPPTHEVDRSVRVIWDEAWR